MSRYRIEITHSVEKDFRKIAKHNIDDIISAI